MEDKKETTAVEASAPRPLSFAENVVLTIKVLGVLGLIGAALWGIDLWNAG